MTIKKVNKESKTVEEIFSFVQNAVKKMDEQQIPQWDDIYPTQEDFALDAQKNQLYIAEVEGKAAACFTLNQECDEAYKDGTWSYEGPDFFIIHRLCVNPEFQNQGIGTKVCLEIENIVKSLGAKAIKLDCFTLNPFSLKMYHKLEYKDCGFADWRKGRFVLMEKIL